MCIYTTDNRQDGKLVACAPFPENHLKTETRNGFAVAKQKNTLQVLDVIFSTIDWRIHGQSMPPNSLGTPEKVFKAGWQVLVPAESFTHQWAKTVYEHDGQRFILVPEQFIKMVFIPNK